MRYFGIEVDDALEISKQTETWHFHRFGRRRRNSEDRRLEALSERINETGPC
jgi:hypothetical protein